MSIIEQHSELHQNMVSWRHWLHQHPELSFNEFLTSDYIASVLEAHDIEMHRGLAKTGIVATIKGKKPGGVIGLRADMDALPIQELNTFKHKSTHDGKMHACGHDGHSTMLLGAAVYLKQHNDFNGMVHCIFQPAEEGDGGGRVMVEEGLFEQFPCDSVYGMHNWPGLAAGKFAVHDSAVMAAVDSIHINIKGKGGHAAMPDQVVDPILAGAQVITALQSIVSRNVSPLQSAVISITIVKAGSISNVIPDEINLTGTLRYFDNDIGETVKKRMRKIVKNTSKAMGCIGKLKVKSGYPATINTPVHAQQCAKSAAKIVGNDKVITKLPPSMGAEDFSYILNESEGAYIWIGNGELSEGELAGGCMLHNTHYDFNDEVSALGASYWVQLVSDILGD